MQGTSFRTSDAAQGEIRNPEKIDGFGKGVLPSNSKTSLSMISDAFKMLCGQFEPLAVGAHLGTRHGG